MTEKRKIHRYTQEEKEFLRGYVQGHNYKEIMIEFTKIFGWEISLQQLKGCIERYGLSTGRTGRFEKGLIPYNKEKKGIYAPGSEKGWFKKGMKPKNYCPVGSERIIREGYIQIKVEEPNKWKMKHHVIWEQANGKIPKGYIITFRDNDKRNTNINNLIMISRKTHVLMNHMSLQKHEGELKDTAVALAKLMLATNEQRRNRV